MEATQNGHLGVVLILLEYNADVNAIKVSENVLKCPPYNIKQDAVSLLSLAGFRGHLEIAKVLLQHGASLNSHQQVHST